MKHFVLYDFETYRFLGLGATTMFLDLYKFRLVGLSNRKISQRSGYYCDSKNAKPDKDTFPTGL